MNNIIITCALVFALGATVAYAQSDGGLQAAPRAPELPTLYQENSMEPLPNAPTLDRFEGDRPVKSGCTVNGRPVDCSEVTGAIKTGLGIFVGILVFGLFALIFWLWMLIHAIKNPIENKALWIICFFIFGLLTAVLYYFMVKRTFGTIPASAPSDSAPTPPPTPAT